MQLRSTILVVIGIIGVVSPHAEATVTTYTNKAAWQSAASSYTTIDFTGHPDGTIIGELYAPLGVHFTDGFDQIYQSTSFVSDGWGLNGAFDDATLVFDQFMTTIAMDFPGHVKVTLFANGKPVYASPQLGVAGVGNFAGLISTIPFDSVHLHDGGLFIDNLYFGPPIPAPGALGAMVFVALAPSRRRRTM